jgi:signal transduction histidine kinase
MQMSNKQPKIVQHKQWRETEQRSQETIQRLRRHWWQTSLAGYLLAVALTGCAFLIPLTEHAVGFQDYFVALPFAVTTLVIGWFWGSGPGLLTLGIEVFVLDYWVIPPLGQLDFFSWPDVQSFVPFITLQLTVLLLVLLQRHYRQRLLLAHRALSIYMSELAASNQALEQSNSQLAEAHRLKDQFLSKASHELKTPVTALQGLVQLARRRLARQPAMPQDFAFLPGYLEKIETQTQRLQTLVNDLLNLNSLRSGKMPLHKAVVNLSDLVCEVAGEQKAITGRDLVFCLPAEPVLIGADTTRLIQVLNNLLSNAFKYSPVDAMVDVAISYNEVEAIIAVHNHGSVLLPEQQTTIFEPFQRSVQAQQSTIQGWGLGLAISKEVVEQHGGHIWVESSEAKGTTFLVSLPICRDGGLPAYIVSAL